MIERKTYKGYWENKANKNDDKTECMMISRMNENQVKKKKRLKVKEYKFKIMDQFKY